MKKAFFTLILFFSGILYAESIKEKYMQTYDKIEKFSASEEEQSRILNENINRALKMTLLEQYNMCNFEKAQISSESYEISELNQNLVYIKYGDFVGYYLFGTNPRKFLQAPQDSNVLLPPGKKITRTYDKECTESTSLPTSADSQENKPKS